MTYSEIAELDKAYVMKTYARLPVAFVKGRGTRLWDDEGREYLDFLGGLGVVNAGHCHPLVVEAIKKQTEKLMHVSNLFYFENQASLAKKLSELVGGGICFFGNSGAEANEGAIKLTRRYANSVDSGSFEIITAYRSFHGRTMKTLAATGQPEKQRPFEPLPPGFVHVPLNNLAALEAAITDKTCAIMLEPIQGEGGVYPCDLGYLREVRRLCDERDILLILDEVQTGVGRTGRFFAYRHYGIEPDIVTLAKGLANGLPVGVVIAKEKVAGCFGPGDHGSTFGGGPVVTAAAIATLNAIEGDRLIENAAEVGDYFKSQLSELAEKKGLKDVRGRGLMLAIELAEPRAKKTVNDLLFKRRIVANAIGDSIIRFLPPLCATRSEVDEVIDALYSEV